MRGPHQLTVEASQEWKHHEDGSDCQRVTALPSGDHGIVYTQKGQRQKNGKVTQMLQIVSV